MPNISFPRGFIWGAATSAYQIEGAVNEDGRSESIWDVFVKEPGRVKDGSTGDVACDHYHRWPEDIALMKSLGLQAYRFSVAWPRIIPTGRGAVNQPGIDFYSRLVDGLLEAGIQPFITLYHWDLPQALQDDGGWAVRSTAEAFVEYSAVVARALGDRVKHWITHNEPYMVSLLGNMYGLHAPGFTDPPLALAVAHHLLLSHGLAVPVLRNESKGAEVGITLNLTPCVPASPSAADHDKAREYDGYTNRWFLDPLHGRPYPADTVIDYTKSGAIPPEGLPQIKPGDYEIIATPCDFLGINYYLRAITQADNSKTPTMTLPDHTDGGWEVYPDGLFEILTRVNLEYHPRKIYVTENGADYLTPPVDGRVPDEKRRTFLRDHLLAARRALDAGAPLAGYFPWSLMDNFEWTSGYTARFGVVWVDYSTQERIPKDSALWYRDVIAANAVPRP